MDNYERDGGLTSNQLKLIAIIAMFIDHIALALFDYYSPIGIVFHTIGRITGPVMFFFAVEGYHRTRNINKYMLRLFIFALISYFPFIFFSARGNIADIDYLKLNVIFTILLGVIALRIRHKIKNPIIKTVLIFLIICLSIFCDWPVAGVVMILIFDYYHGNYKYQAFSYSIYVLMDRGLLDTLLSPFYSLIDYGEFNFRFESFMYDIVAFGMLIPIFLLRFYNGKLGNNGKFSKWFFYIFYPTHLILLAFIAYAIDSYNLYPILSNNM